MRIVYTSEQKQHAIKTYKKLKSYSATLRVLGYPSRHILFDWVRGRSHKKAGSNPSRKAKHYSWQLKLEAVTHVLHGEKIQEVADSLAIVNYAVIYVWIRNWQTKGLAGFMSKKEQIEKGIYKTKAQLKKELPDNVGELKQLAARLLAEKAVLEQELELTKKSTGGIPVKLSARNKTQITNDLRGRLPLELLLKVLSLKSSSYYSACCTANKPDKYREVRVAIHKISDESGHTYGSPRIWFSLRKQGIVVSEKVIRCLVREERIEVRYARRKRKYSSYIGEITPAIDDLVKRNFHADSPNTLWLTDITEFSAADSKIYLSPLIDCLDGKVVSWKTSKHPNSLLVESMIDQAIDTLDRNIVYKERSGDNTNRLVIHTDRGGHYRGGMWIEKLEGQVILRSMSRKGNSGDNAACEGFFGRMKTEMYYGIRWSKASELEAAIHEYIDFYNNRRIKMSLGGLSIKEYRDKLAKVSEKQS